MTELVEIGQNIVKLRREQALTQEEVAFRSFLSVSRLQSLEYGCQNTTVDTLIRVAGTLGIDSRIFCTFSKSDPVILREYRRSPRLPEKEGKALQVCDNVFLLRKASGLTQKQFASRSHISVGCLRNIECGCGNITVHTLLRVAGAFGLTLAELGACAMSEEYLMELVRDARTKAGIRMG